MVQIGEQRSLLNFFISISSDHPHHERCCLLIDHLESCPPLIDLLSDPVTTNAMPPWLLIIATSRPRGPSP
jgi:hypothetical protein